MQFISMLWGRIFELVRQMELMLLWKSTISMPWFYQRRGLVRLPPASQVSHSVTHLLIAGYPMVTVPLGQLNETGQPFGLSFIGTVFWSQILSDE
jgi:hypothetical protein